jgi:hypothetical protein
MSISIGLLSGTNGLDVIYINLITNSIYIQWLREVILLVIQNAAKIGNQITIFILCRVTSRLVNILTFSHFLNIFCN